MKRSAELEQAAVLDAAQLMAAAARTAPKTRGIDTIEVFAIDDEETRTKLVAMMRTIGERENRPSMVRDAASIAASPLIVVIGVRAQPAGLNCGACGYATCATLAATPGICSYNTIDLGIAVGSAVAVAGDLRIDNRIMYSIGKAAIALKLTGDGVRQALGIPLSITGKSPFFDRK